MVKHDERKVVTCSLHLNIFNPMPNICLRSLSRKYWFKNLIRTDYLRKNKYIRIIW